MNKAELSGVCRQMRRDIINMTANAGSGHPGGSLSAVELMASVFYNHMRIDPENPRWASSAATNSRLSASCTASCRVILTARRYPAWTPPPARWVRAAPSP